MTNGASWSVDYEGGEGLSQYDKDGNEVPYRAIDWSRVRALRFENQDLVATFDITPPPPGTQLSLRSRHFMGTSAGADGGTDVVTCFMLVESDAGYPVDAEHEEHIHTVIYWFPNGVYHVCYQFECPEMRQYGSCMVHGTPHDGVMPIHDRTLVAASGLLA